MTATTVLEPIVSRRHIDEQLEHEVTASLFERHMPSLRKIIVTSIDGTITLRGVVHSFYERQLCLSCCQRIPGIRRLVDLIEVAA